MRKIAELQGETDFRVFREQKVLLSARDANDRQALADAFAAAADQRLPVRTALECRRYAEFTVVALGILNDVASEVSRHTRDARRFPLSELVTRLNDLAVSSFVEKAAADHDRIEEALREGEMEVHQRVDRSEWLVHESEGSNNDMLFAFARTFSHLSVNHQQGPIISADPAAADNILSCLVYEASRINAIEYLMDMVSYGEWYVEEITQGVNPVVRFNIRDPRLTRARILGIRRHLIETRFGNKRPDTRGSALKELLRELMKGMLHSPTGWNANVILSSTVQDEVERVLTPLIATLGRDDWNLLAAAETDERLAIKYLAGFALRCAMLAVDIARRAGRIGEPELRAAMLNPKSLLSIHLADERLDRLLHEELQTLVSKAKTASWIDLLSHPFLEVHGMLVGLPCLMTQNWTESVRAEVGTGAIGKNYGALWEDEIEALFRTHGWDCVRGINMAASGALPATDADIIATRGDVCVVVQVKAIARSGLTPYHNWKARHAILKGADQAINAASKLRDDARLRISILGGKRARLALRIVPLVVTNAMVFSGWEVDGVPVLSASSLSSLLKGGETQLIRFANGQRSSERLPYATRAPIDFTTMLHEPAEWGFATETEAIGHTLSTDFRVHFALPHLVRSE